MEVLKGALSVAQRSPWDQQFVARDKEVGIGKVVDPHDNSHRSVIAPCNLTKHVSPLHRVDDVRFVTCLWSVGSSIVCLHLRVWASRHFSPSHLLITSGTLLKPIPNRWHYYGCHPGRDSDPYKSYDLYDNLWIYVRHIRLATL
jgi:hypothetical protein